MSHVCPSCGASNQITTTIEEDRFPYGEGPNAPILKADVPVHTCGKCSAQYVGHVGMAMRDFAVLRHLIHRGDVPNEILKRMYPIE